MTEPNIERTLELITYGVPAVGKVSAAPAISSTDLIIDDIAGLCRRFVERWVDAELLALALADGFALTCDAVTGKVIALSDEMVTFRSVSWSRHDVKARPVFSVRTIWRRQITNLRVADAVRPIRIR